MGQGILIKTTKAICYVYWALLRFHSFFVDEESKAYTEWRVEIGMYAMFWLLLLPIANIIQELINRDDENLLIGLIIAIAVIESVIIKLVITFRFKIEKAVFLKMSSEQKSFKDTIVVALFIISIISGCLSAYRFKNYQKEHGDPAEILRSGLS